MRLDRAWLLGMCFCLLSGCAHDQPPANMSWINNFRTFWPGKNEVELEIAVLRIPLGEGQAADELWQYIDEQVVPLEKRPLLEANGLRVGSIHGSASAGWQNLLQVADAHWNAHDEANLTLPQRTLLQTLLRERKLPETTPLGQVPADVRALAGCPNHAPRARRTTSAANKPIFVPVGNGDRDCLLKMFLEGDSRSIDFLNAQFGLWVEIKPGDDRRRMLMRFEPAVQHGEALRLPKPLNDRGDWGVDANRPEERFTALSWDALLGPDDFIVIGGIPEDANTFGYHGFVEPDAETPVQTLIVIRGAHGSIDPFGPPARSNDPSPLAWQSLYAKPSADTLPKSK